MNLYDLKDVTLGILSVLLLSWYFLASILTIANLTYNRDVMSENIAIALKVFLIGAFFAILAGFQWTVKSHYMLVETWQAFAWSIVHLCLPYSIYRINVHICEQAKIKCDMIRKEILGKIKTPYQEREWQGENI